MLTKDKITTNHLQKLLLVALVFFLCLGVGLSFVAKPNNAYADTEGSELLASYKQVAFNDENGLPTSDANCVTQTSNGYILVGGYSGILRYDGRKFGSLTFEGIKSSSINAIFEDNKKRLWIGTNDAGLYLVNEGRVATKIGEDTALATASIQSIIQYNGYILAASRSGLAVIDKEMSLKLITKDNIISMNTASFNNILSVAASNGQIWGVLNGGFVFGMDFRFNVFFYKDSAYFNNHTPNAVFCLNDKIYVGTTDNCVIELDSDGTAVEYHDTDMAETINSFYHKNDDKLSICSDSGVGYFGLASDGKINSSFHMLNNTVYTASIEMMTEDYEGSYWFASSRKGVMQLVKSKFSNLNVITGASEQVVNSTVKYEGLLYYGSDIDPSDPEIHGLVAVDENYNLVTNAITNLLASTRIRCLTTDDEGNLWIACYNNNFGVIRYGGGDDIEIINCAKGLPSAKVRVLKVDLSGKILVGTGSGLAIISQNETTGVYEFSKTYTTVQGLSNPEVLSLEQTSDGSIYVGSNGGGIYKIINNSVSNFTMAAGLTSNIILRMTKDPLTDAIWVSTGADLCLLDGGNVRQLETSQSSNVSIYDIKFIKNDNGGYNVWLLSATGIISLDRSKTLLGEDAYIESFHKRDGLFSNITANSWNYIDENNVLYLSCGTGVSTINTNRIYRNVTKPALVINSIKVDGEAVALDKNNQIPLDSSATKLEISYAMLSFTTSEGVVKYKLEGYDKDYNQISTDNIGNLLYMNLNGGSYRLHIVGYNNDGTETANEITVTIIKKLAFFEMLWVKILSAILIAATIIVVVTILLKANNKKMLKRQTEYKDITEQALKSISSTIDAKDKYTNGHSRRVAEYSVKLAQSIGLSKANTERLYYTALLHDIGKIGIPDNILNKPSKLTDDKFAAIRRHPSIGGDILKDFTAVEGIADGAKYHHEHYNGGGYNEGLKGDDIPLFARIIGVADTFDAMNSTRPYRSALAMSEIVAELIRVSGTQLDPEIVGLLLRLIDSGEIHKRAYAPNPQTAVKAAAAVTAAKAN